MKVLYILILLLVVSCSVKKDNEPEAKYRITVDDGNGHGIMSITNYGAISYELAGETGVKFITTNGKEHFTNYKVTIKEL